MDSIEALKRCSKCKETKSLSSFSRDKARRDGYQPYCKSCYREYYNANQVDICEQKREYYDVNRERRSNSNREYYKANREQVRANVRQYKQNNPEVYRTASHRRRAREYNAEGSHTAQEWLEVVWRQRFACACCGGIKSLERDHIIPLSKGGSNYISNIQGLCRSCNSIKSAKMPNGVDINETRY